MHSKTFAKNARNIFYMRKFEQIGNYKTVCDVDHYYLFGTKIPTNMILILLKVHLYGNFM